MHSSLDHELPYALATNFCCVDPSRTREILSLGCYTWALCGIPLFLALGVAVTFMVGGTRPWLVLKPLEPTAAASSEDPLAVLHADWNFQQERVRAARWPIVALTVLHGGFASTLLLVSTWLLRHLLPVCAGDDAFLPQLYAGMMRDCLIPWSLLELSAFAVIASVGLHSALAFGRLYRRAARHDLTPLAIAEALRGLIASALLTVAVVSLMLRDLPWLTPMQVLLVGGTMSLVGPGLTDLIYQGTSIFFGLYSTSEDGLVDCTEVDGLDDVDRQRLQELGIDSLHSLAYSSVALLYLGSRYTYERICDWKDQALLEILVGKQLKRRLADQYGVRGAVSLLDALNSKALDPSALGDDGRLIQVLRSDRSVALLRAWKACYPCVRST